MLHLIFNVLTYLVYFLVIVFTINHIAVYFYLAIEYKLQNLKHPLEFPNISAWYFWSNCIIEYNYVWSKFYLLPWKFKDLSVNVAPSATAPAFAILLVHGFCRSQTDWMWFKKNIADLGCPIFSVNLKPQLASIEEITQQSLVPKIAEIKRLTNCQNIILIGHSMGGLVSSYYAENLDTANVVHSVITIATLFYGSNICVMAAGINGSQMCPGAQFTNDLRAKISQTKKQYFNVASRFDNIIFPWNSAILDNVPVERQFILPRTSHLQLLHSQEVVEKIKQWVVLT